MASYPSFNDKDYDLIKKITTNTAEIAENGGGGGGSGITQLTGDVTAGPGSGSKVATIASNAVTSAKIADSNVTTAKIADSNVTTAKIADANVTLAKMANLAQDQFIGRTTASTGVPETATITAAARTVLDDTTVAAMVDTLGGASSSGTGGLVRTTNAALDLSGSGGAIKLPNTTAPSAEGQESWDQTNKTHCVHDGQRLLFDEVGWAPAAYPFGTSPASAQTSTITLAASGGTCLMPIFVIGHGLLQSYTWRNMDTSGTRAVELRLYRQKLNNGNAGENSIDFVTGTDASSSISPGAASNNTANVSGAPVYIAPGWYWLAMRTTNASTYGLAGVGGSGSLAKSEIQTKTLGSSLGSTLDAVAATWTKSNTLPIASLDFRVFGQTAAY